MSSKLQLKPLLSKHQISNEHTVILNNNFCDATYDQEIESNARIILKRYQYLDRTKVRNLLEEL